MSEGNAETFRVSSVNFTQEITLHIRVPDGLRSLSVWKHRVRPPAVFPVKVTDVVIAFQAKKPSRYELLFIAVDGYWMDGKMADGRSNIHVRYDANASGEELWGSSNAAEGPPAWLMDLVASYWPPADRTPSLWAWLEKCQEEVQAVIDEGNRALTEANDHE